MAGKTGTRITMTIPPKQYQILCELSNSTTKNAGEMAKEIVMEGLDYLAEMLSVAKTPEISADMAIRKMYKKALTDIADTIDQPLW